MYVRRFFSTLKSNGPIKYIPLYVCIYFSLTKTLKFMYVCMWIVFVCFLRILYVCALDELPMLYSGAAWNEFNNYQYQTFESQLMNYICSPSTGACYFFLFLVRLQTRALILLHT